MHLKNTHRNIKMSNTLTRQVLIEKSYSFVGELKNRGYFQKIHPFGTKIFSRAELEFCDFCKRRTQVKIGYESFFFGITDIGLCERCSMGFDKFLSL